MSSFHQFFQTNLTKRFHIREYCKIYGYTWLFFTYDCPIGNFLDMNLVLIHLFLHLLVCLWVMPVSKHLEIPGVPKYSSVCCYTTNKQSKNIIVENTEWHLQSKFEVQNLKSNLWSLKFAVRTHSSELWSPMSELWSPNSDESDLQSSVKRLSVS